MDVYVYKKANGEPFVLTEKEAYYENKQNKPLVRRGEKQFIGVADDTQYRIGAEQIKHASYKKARERAVEQGFRGEALKEQTMALQVEILRDEYSEEMQQLLDDLVAQAEKNGPRAPRDRSVIEVGSGGASVSLASDTVRRQLGK